VSPGSGGEDGGDGNGAADAGDGPENDGSRFDRLPATPADRRVAGRASRSEVLDWYDDRFGIRPERFDGHSLWEKGTGKVWLFAGDLPDPATVEAAGLTVLRTRREHWKPTTRAVQRFGRAATRNVLTLGGADAARFAAGEDLAVDRDGDWGYLIVAHELAGEREPIGVGLYVRGELRSTVPKGSRAELPPSR